MPRVYILIDFENVQPTAQDLALIRGTPYQVRIFHGPHQNKFDAAMVKALQPLGAQVEYVQCGHRGKNALDFHVAFYLGRIFEERHRDGVNAQPLDRIVVISNDSGFDALLEHIQSLGCAALKVANVKQAIETGVPMVQIASPSFAVANTSPSKLPTTKTTPVLPVAAKKIDALGIREKLIDNLRAHPKNRPSGRKALVSYVGTIAGGKQTAKSIDALIAGLERDGILVVTEKRIDYILPKKTK